MATEVALAAATEEHTAADLAAVPKEGAKCVCHLTWKFWCLNVVICVNVNLRNMLTPRYHMKSKHLGLK